jgi:hypothetical protein
LQDQIASLSRDHVGKLLELQSKQKLDLNQGHISKQE